MRGVVKNVHVACCSSPVLSVSLRTRSGLSVIANYGFRTWKLRSPLRLGIQSGQTQIVSVLQSLEWVKIWSVTNVKHPSSAVQNFPLILPSRTFPEFHPFSNQFSLSPDTFSFAFGVANAHRTSPRNKRCSHKRLSPTAAGSRVDWVST